MYGEHDPVLRTNARVPRGERRIRNTAQFGGCWLAGCLGPLSVFGDARGEGIRIELEIIYEQKEREHATEMGNSSKTLLRVIHPLLKPFTV